MAVAVGRVHLAPPRIYPASLGGEPLNGATILLHAEQGLGDTLQFVRYAPLVAARGGRVVLEVQPALYRLLRDLPGVAVCIPAGSPLPGFDLHCPLLTLPTIFATTLTSVPPVAPFRPPPTNRRLLSDLLKVGVCWAGNPAHAFDQLRSMAVHHLHVLTEVPGTVFFALQKDTRLAELTSLRPPLPVADACSACNDFADTADIIDGLDLVISIDTSMAHLAASLGKPTWILLSHVPEWRWGLSGETSPWYPQARLFRRSFTGGWEELMQRVARELQVLVASRDHPEQAHLLVNAAPSDARQTPAALHTRDADQE